MLKYDDFLTPQTVASIIKSRISRYEKIALDFLRQEFSPAISLLSEEQTLEVIRLAYKNAYKKGVRAEREHLKYLIPVMYWGSYFEEDPQYFCLLQKAGWLNNKGEALHAPYVAPVLEQVDYWFNATKLDLEQPNRLMWGFAQIYKSAPERISLQFVLRYMELLWPERSLYMLPEQKKTFAEITYEIAREKSFGGVDGVVYSCLALYFGFRFSEDPRYPWARDVFSNDGLSREQLRASLGEKSLDYWDGLLEVSDV